MVCHAESLLSEKPFKSVNVASIFAPHRLAYVGAGTARVSRMNLGDLFGAQVKTMLRTYQAGRGCTTTSPLTHVSVKPTHSTSFVLLTLMKCLNIHAVFPQHPFKRGISAFSADWRVRATDSGSFHEARGCYNQTNERGMWMMRF